MKLFLFCVAAVAHGQPIDNVAKEWKYAERDNEVLDNYLKVFMVFSFSLFTFKGKHLWLVVTKASQNGSS